MVDSKDTHTEPDGTVSGDEHLVPEDDTVIGVALRRSLVALVGIAILAVLVWWLAGRSPEPEVIETAELSAPVVDQSSDPGQAPEIPFRDRTAPAGLNFDHENGAEGERLLPETMGGGVAFFDFDGDEDQDLLLVNSMRWPWAQREASAATSVLYRNDGSGTFTDVTKGSGLEGPLYGMGVATGDYDGDGLVDLFITAVGANRLYRNEGGGQFRDVTKSAGVAGDDDRWSTSAAFLDYDRDGDIDLFVANYVVWSRELDIEVDYRIAGIGRAYGPPTNFPGTDGYLYRNEGDGRFTDVSAESGIRVSNPATGLPAGKGLAVLADDLDADGWPDLVVANDTVRNFFFRNLGGRFEEVGTASGLAFDNSGSATGAMGIDGARYTNAGEYAIAIGNFANEMTSFYVAPGQALLFTDEANIAGIGAPSRAVLSFGLFFFDADLDGRQDLFQANGHVENDINLVQPSQQHAQPAQLFWNCGAGCRRPFVPLPAESIADLAQPLVGRGAAYADIEGDGDLDIVVTQAGGPARLFVNEQARGNHWLRVRLVGAAPNTAALGARIVLHGGGKIQERRVFTARSYLSQTELTQTFGLGGAEDIERLEVHWPDGSVEQHADLPADRLVVITRGEPEPAIH